MCSIGAEADDVAVTKGEFNASASILSVNPKRGEAGESGGRRNQETDP